MKSWKNERGITLISLGVTIIIMLVLTDLVIYEINSDEGIFKKKEQVENRMQSDIETTENKISDMQEQWGNIINRKGIENDIDNR